MLTHHVEKCQSASPLPASLCFLQRLLSTTLVRKALDDAGKFRGMRCPSRDRGMQLTQPQLLCSPGQNMSANTPFDPSVLFAKSCDRNPFVCLLTILCKTISIMTFSNPLLGQRILQAPPSSCCQDNIPLTELMGHLLASLLLWSPQRPAFQTSQKFPPAKIIRSHKNQPVALIWTLSCWETEARSYRRNTIQSEGVPNWTHSTNYRWELPLCHQVSLACGCRRDPDV